MLHVRVSEIRTLLGNHLLIETHYGQASQGSGSDVLIDDMAMLEIGMQETITKPISLVGIAQQDHTVHLVALRVHTSWHHLGR